MITLGFSSNWWNFADIDWKKCVKEKWKLLFLKTLTKVIFMSFYIIKCPTTFITSQFTSLFKIIVIFTNTHRNNLFSLKPWGLEELGLYIRLI